MTLFSRSVSKFENPKRVPRRALVPGEGPSCDFKTLKRTVKKVMILSKKDRDTQPKWRYSAKNNVVMRMISTFMTIFIIPQLQYWVPVNTVKLYQAVASFGEKMRHKNSNYKAKITNLILHKFTHTWETHKKIKTLNYRMIRSFLGHNFTTKKSNFY